MTLTQRARRYVVTCSCRSNHPAACDIHRVPTVCVCDHPVTDAIGECIRCCRPYKPEVPGFDTCREAWRTHLLQESIRA